MDFNKMKINILIFILAFSLNSYSQSKKEKEFPVEDIWGNVYNFNDIIASAKPVLIQPFSTSNCGYCLMDGHYIEKNYFENNLSFGGQSFMQCLFNPQLDIYAYCKHYKTAVPVLTYPVGLHKYHNDGFPTILAFKNGKQICNTPLLPYFDQFDSLRKLFWNDSTIKKTLTSDIRFVDEEMVVNKKYEALCIVGNNDTLYYRKKINQSEHLRSFTVKYVADISESDLKKNIWISGYSLKAFLPILKKINSPFRFDDNNFYIGNYSFPISETKLITSFPNPFNKEKSFYINIRPETSIKNFDRQYVDYCIFKSSKDSAHVLMDGFFDKKNRAEWRYADSLNFSYYSDISSYCNGICKAPKVIQTIEHTVRNSDFKREQSFNGKMISLGNSNCRFPSIETDKSNNCWVTWEEEGDIYLAQLADDTIKTYEAVESDNTDSYNPLLAIDNKNNIWVFYLNNKDGFYRLYAKYYDNVRFSDEILISNIGPFDVITPSVFSKGDAMVISWTEWLSNMRILECKKIKNNCLSSSFKIPLMKSVQQPSYQNAWYSQLTIDDNNKICGVWNQHYPASFGVYASTNIEKDSTFSVTKYDVNIDNCENGGYSSIVCDKQNRKWYFWETSAWDVALDFFGIKTQSIKACYYDDKAKSLSVPMIISLKTQTRFNQTPFSAVDTSGVIYLVWSGRSKDERNNWGIFLSYYKNSKWSKPLLISPENENARSPKISINKDSNRVWVCWHAGRGSEMKIKVLEYNGGIN